MAFPFELEIFRNDKPEILAKWKALQVGTLLIRLVQGPPLLGQDMISKFTLPWQTIFRTISTAAEDIVQQYSDLFVTGSVGKLKGIQVSL